MLEQERKKLEEHSYNYISIGISADGKGQGSYWIPWRSTACAFNMRLPHVFLTPEDLADPEIMELLGKYEVIGCYVYTELEDYSVLSRFTQLQDIQILCGKNLKDLSFMKDMKEWFMLYIEGATLEDISAAFDRGERGFAIHSYCLGFVDCRIKDTAPIKASGLRLSELVVHSKVEDMIYEQWKDIPAGHRSLHILRDDA